MNAEPIVFEIPDLADDRLRLRPWRLEDAPSLARAWTDIAIVEGSSPPADRSVESARRWIEGWDERRRAGVAFDLVVVDDDDLVVGEVGLARVDPGRRVALIGWWVHEEARGRGVASAAVTLLTSWAVGPGGLRAVVAEIGSDNDVSIRVAERAGFTQIERPRNPQDSARGHTPRVWYLANSTVK